MKKKTMNSSRNRAVIIGGSIVLVGIIGVVFLKEKDVSQSSGSDTIMVEEMEDNMGSSMGNSMGEDIMGMDMEGEGIMMENFSAVAPEMFQKMMDMGGYTVLDVRTPEEIAQGKVRADALEMNFYDADFATQLGKLDKTKKYLVVCRSGNRSGKAVKMMQELGFREVYDLQGGMNAWMARGMKMNQ